MGWISRIKGWFEMIFKNVVKEEFRINSIVSSTMENMIERYAKIYAGNPDWVSSEDGIKTINFAKSVCSETARLALLGTKITIGGDKRAEYLQQQVDKIYYKLREWVEYGCAYGTVVLKPNGVSVDCILPNNFIVTDQSNGEITGIVFINQETSEDGKKYYTRLEYHRFVEDGIYAISNKCYVSKKKGEKGELIDIKLTPWKKLDEEVAIQNMTEPLFGVLRMPAANNVELGSPLGLSIFSDAIEELKDLDMAYSRNAEEIDDSRRTVLLDSDRLTQSGNKVNNTVRGFENAKKELKLPKYVKMVYGTTNDEVYHEINPNLNTDTRLTGINALLSQIGYKIGFSNGYFVFNESTGMITATQVDSDDRRTIQFIKDIRDQIEKCLKGLVGAINVFADLYDLAPVGKYEIIFDFGDITYNLEEDRKRWWGYVVQGKVPAWKYFVKFEGMSEEEAKEMVLEAKEKEPTLFGLEE